MNPTTATPVEIDAVLAEIYGKRSEANRIIASYTEHLDYLVKRAAKFNREVFPADRRSAEEAIAEARGTLRRLNVEAAPLEAEFAARRWSRFFLVTSSQGLIHSHMDCSTCNNGKQDTQFGWLPELSGSTEADAVAAHGALLCTVCFPSAPVHFTNGRELEAAAKAAAKCPGTRDYDAPSRTGYYTGNWATCTCGQRVTLTSAGNLRAHKPA